MTSRCYASDVIHGFFPLWRWERFTQNWTFFRVAFIALWLTLYPAWVWRPSQDLGYRSCLLQFTYQCRSMCRVPNWNGSGPFYRSRDSRRGECKSYYCGSFWKSASRTWWSCSSWWSGGWEFKLSRGLTYVIEPHIRSIVIYGILPYRDTNAFSHMSF